MGGFAGKREAVRDERQKLSAARAGELFPGALNGVQGIVRYSDPFRI